METIFALMIVLFTKTGLCFRGAINMVEHLIINILNRVDAKGVSTKHNR